MYPRRSPPDTARPWFRLRPGSASSFETPPASAAEWEGGLNRSMQRHLIRIQFLKVVFMAEGKRNRLSIEQRIDMWRRWKAGESLHDIGRAFGKAHNSIRFLLMQRGGIVPATRRRSPRTLTLAEREDISRGIASGLSIREIASGLQRPVSTVSREVSRHGGRPMRAGAKLGHSAPRERSTAAE